MKLLSTSLFASTMLLALLIPGTLQAQEEIAVETSKQCPGSHLLYS